MIHIIKNLIYIKIFRNHDWNIVIDIVPFVNYLIRMQIVEKYNKLKMNY